MIFFFKYVYWGTWSSYIKWHNNRISVNLSDLTAIHTISILSFYMFKLIFIVLVVFISDVLIDIVRRWYNGDFVINDVSFLSTRHVVTTGEREAWSPVMAIWRTLYTRTSFPKIRLRIYKRGTQELILSQSIYFTKKNANKVKSVKRLQRLRSVTEHIMVSWVLFVFLSNPISLPLQFQY